MMPLETERLRLTPLSYDDAEFIVELVNEPSFKRYIGDKNVHSIDDARRYLDDGPIAVSIRYGYGMYRVSTKDDGSAAGICGLLRREGFDDPDLGFAFLSRFRMRGYAGESARAVLQQGFGEFGLDRIIAMANPENEASLHLLEKLGFHYHGKARMPGDDFDINLYALEK
ncbi:MAG: GNAT family N-acetyltransferase [Woeseiaceae bacterium]|nr:GNAT family N-acetyltransferase [Woeseiaceae bacterium]